MVPLKHNARILVKPAATAQPKVKPLSILNHFANRPRPVAQQPAFRQPIRVRGQRAALKLPVAMQHRQIPSTRLRSPKSPWFKIDLRLNLDSIWKIKGVGKGRILIIVGNGPTHKEAPLPELAKQPNIDIMAINKPDERLWPPKYWLFCDNTQLKRHRTLWEAYQGIVINSSAIREAKQNGVRVKSLHVKGFSTDLREGMVIGHSSVYAALQVALWMDYDHVYVFGCDMNAVGGKLYSWGSNPDVSDDARMKRFKVESESYQWMADNVRIDIKKRYTFCSKYNPWLFTKAFEILDHMEAIKIIIDRHCQPAI